ncbi:hypothetical protein [Vibrio cholerae]|uniref:hypothetical protein n=1 Tax=Vibrio cholerae TaxID=666 RepID=UPI001663580D|nr:hypothetical protein [Vibrio cholerae]EIN5961877.1 hypothetical protein [Vibrio cholerae]EKF9857658.1 hypothetical protein [Vibrio cholerae]GFK35483.1 hypothetical protein VcPa01_03681 [Vibrio cholerae]GFK38961.1 hypothetical protein VcPa02_03603 [Vibrio cholerae]GFK42515.1 hypothetical protein VcPa03_03661 [Vibrio cholerae]
MDKIELTNEYIEQVSEQFKLWANFLNTGIGLLSFTLAIACMGTESPTINAVLSLIVIFFVRISGSQYFPHEIQQLRAKAKSDEKAKIILLGLEKKYFGFKTNFTMYPMFVFGLFFLIAVSMSTSIAKILPWWGTYVGL